jgi:peroxiredoxin-like protein
MDSHYYQVNIAWSHDRQGMICSPELNATTDNCIEVATPPEFPKGIPGVWSPEHLFTASVSSCLMTTFLAIAEKSRLAFSSFTCGSRGKLEQREGKFVMSEIQLFPVVTVADEKDRERALRVLEKAEANCLISHSIKSVITLTPEVIVSNATAVAPASS